MYAATALWNLKHAERRKKELVMLFTHQQNHQHKQIEHEKNIGSAIVQMKCKPETIVTFCKSYWSEVAKKNKTNQLRKTSVLCLHQSQN